MPPKIKDIAKLVSLSPATVSMVLNNRPGFSEETRNRVLEAARELNYQPSSTKRIATELSETLPFVICKRHGRVVTETPSALIEGIESQAKSDGFKLSVHYLYMDHGTAINELHAIVAQSKMGFLMLATELERTDCEALDMFAVPYVLIDNSMLGFSADKVLIGNRQGAYAAVNELYRCGHRKIGYLHSSVWISNFAEREVGYRMALREKGIEAPKEWVAHVGSTHEEAYSDMLNYCDQCTDMPTAFFADNDFIALGAMKALRERGYNIPGDVSLIGFDDTPYSTIVTPNLTTMRVDMHSIGKEAVRLLLKKNSYRSLVEVEVTLVRRQSVRTI